MQYIFIEIIHGEGETREDAWENAVDNFCNGPLNRPDKSFTDLYLAAPDMLEALEDLAKYVMSSTSDIPIALINARTAITKAKP